MTSFWLASHPIAATGTPLRPGESAEVCVVGAGLTGLVTAVLLARTGRRVILVEARTVGAVTSGNTTAKLSLLQGSVLSELRGKHSAEVVRAYVESNRAGQQWLTAFLGAAGVAVQERTAWSYASGAGGVRRLEQERSAATAAGLAVTRDDATELPFPVAGAIRLDDQVQFHATAVLDALLSDFLDHGGVLHTGCRVQGVSIDERVEVRTQGAGLVADHVVLATGTPIVDRGGHFAVLQPQRSYALAARVPGVIPQGMYLSIDTPTRSLRTAPAGDGSDDEVLLVGGNGHPVGRARDTRRRVRDLDAWTARWFPGAEVTHRWSAQDYAPAAGLPVVDVLAGSRGRVLLATGYHKWGMTNAVASALRLVSRVDAGQQPDWAPVLDHASRLTGWPAVATFNAEVGFEATRGWLAAGVRALPQTPPAEGRGEVGRYGARPAGVSTVDGVTCMVSAVCTHLGGVVTWNEAERSWDCPLHGSRFAADGTVLEGPATTALPRLD